MPDPGRRSDLPPYEHGFYDGQDHLHDDEYYDTLSEDGRIAYDLGFYDGDGGHPHRDRHSQQGQQAQQREPQAAEGISNERCMRCGGPLNMALDARFMYICFDCYTLLLDNHLLKPETFWSYTREEINQMFEELNRRFAQFDPLEI